MAWKLGNLETDSRLSLRSEALPGVILWGWTLHPGGEGSPMGLWGFLNVEAYVPRQ